jgi:predicted  nucleic acid-binding Zn-ribbon protein
VDQAISEGTTARMELVYSCDDVDLRRKMDELEVEVRRVEESLRDLNVRAGRLDCKVCYEREATGDEPINSEATRRREQAATYEKEAEAIRRDAKKFEKAQADLTKRREQIEQRMRQF